MLTFGGGFITYNGFGQIIDADANDLTALLQQTLAPGANIGLYGCNTANGNQNLTQMFAGAFPNVNVTGYYFYAIGGINFHWYWTAGFTSTYSAQIFGNSQP